MEYIKIILEVFIEDNGKMINKMEWEQNYYLMAPLMKDIIKMD